LLYEVAVSTIAELLLAGRPLMEASPRESGEDSRAITPETEDSGIPVWLGWLLLLLGLGGAVLLIVAEFSDVYEVKVVTAVIKRQSGHAQHSYGLLVIGLIGLPMAWAAIWAASRPAMLGLLALGVITLLIALGNDLPDINSAGSLGRARNFEDAEPSPKPGFYLETLGAVLMIIAAVGMLVMTAPSRLGTRAGKLRLPRLPSLPRPPARPARNPGESQAERAARSEEERVAAARARAEARSRRGEGEA
jgi:hypothetical protein